MAEATGTMEQLMTYRRRSSSVRSHNRDVEKSGGRRRRRSSGGQKRKSSTGGRHWRDIAPRYHSRERSAMAHRCRHCFLLPDMELYPVCPRGSCEPTTQGVRAAIRRARLEIAQYPHVAHHQTALHRGLTLARKMGMSEGFSTRRSSRSK